MKTLDKAATVIVIVGGLNWGLIGFFDYNLVEKIFSSDLSTLIYDVVGIAAAYMLLKFLSQQNRQEKHKK